MKNINKHLKILNRIITSKNFTTKIKVYMSTTAGGDDYDPYEDKREYTNLPYITIKGYVRDLTAESTSYKGYGIHYSGIKEILCEKRWKEAFKYCNKIVINDTEYQTMKDAGNKASITERPFNYIRVTIAKKD